MVLSEVEDEGVDKKDDQPTDEEAEEQKEPTPPQANKLAPVTWDSLGEQRKFFNFDIMPKVNKYVCTCSLVLTDTRMHIRVRARVHTHTLN